MKMERLFPYMIIMLKNSIIFKNKCCLNNMLHESIIDPE